MDLKRFKWGFISFLTAVVFVFFGIFAFIIFILLTIYAVIKRIKQGYNNIKDSITRIVNKRLISRKANKENNRKKA